MKKVNEINALEARIAELEKANFDLEWNLRLAEKKSAAATPAPVKVKAVKVKAAKVEKAVSERDPYGCRVGTLRAELNAYVTEAIMAEKYNVINAGRLAKIANGKYSVARFNQHLNWMRSYNWI